MDVSWSGRARARAAALLARPGDGALEELLELVDAAPNLASLTTLRSVHLRRLSSDELSMFRFSNADAHVLLYAVDASGRPHPTHDQSGALDHVLAVCVVELKESQVGEETA